MGTGGIKTHRHNNERNEEGRKKREGRKEDSRLHVRGITNDERMETKLARLLCGPKYYFKRAFEGSGYAGCRAKWLTCSIAWDCHKSLWRMRPRPMWQLRQLSVRGRVTYWTSHSQCCQRQDLKQGQWDATAQSLNVLASGNVFSKCVGPVTLQRLLGEGAGFLDMWGILTPRDLVMGK